jgi:hypothetical protein
MTAAPGRVEFPTLVRLRSHGPWPFGDQLTRLTLALVIDDWHRGALLPSCANMGFTGSSPSPWQLAA